MPKVHILGIVCLSAFGIVQPYRVRLLRWPRRLRHTFPQPCSCAMRRAFRASYTIRGTDQGNFGSMLRG
jgi:hypothetical protein